MGHRVVVGLKWARPRTEGAPFGNARPRGAKRQGLLYEAALARHLPSAKHGQWFDFEDINGLGLAQPDFLLRSEENLVILESKYSWVPEAESQIERLYRPILAIQTPRPILGVIVAKRLTSVVRGPICGSLREAIARSSPGRPSTWHWLGGESGSTQFCELGEVPISAGRGPSESAGHMA